MTKVVPLNWDSQTLKAIQKRFKHWGYASDQLTENMYRTGNITCKLHGISRCQKCSHGAFVEAQKKTETKNP